ncbi:hypothetical protein Q5752_005630 [Cryptotrichosporon argae]
MPAKRSPSVEHGRDEPKRHRLGNAVASSSRVTLDTRQPRRSHVSASESDEDEAVDPDDDRGSSSSRPSTGTAAPAGSRRVLSRLNPHWTYELRIIQQPDRARACGFGNKDRRPISPPTIAQLIIRHGGEIVSADLVPSHFLMLSATLVSEHYDERGIVLQAGQKAPETMLPSPVFAEAGFLPVPSYEASTRPTTASSYRPTTNGSPAIGPEYDGRQSYAVTVPPSPMLGHYRHPSSPQHAPLPSIDQVAGIVHTRHPSVEKAYGTRRIQPDESPDLLSRPDTASSWDRRSDGRRPVGAASFEDARFDSYRQKRPSTSHDRREGYHHQLEQRPSTSYADFRHPAAGATGSGRTPPTPTRSLYTGWAPESPYSFSPLPPRPEHGHGHVHALGAHAHARAHANAHAHGSPAAGSPFAVDAWELNVIRSAQLYTHTLVGQHHALATCLLDMDGVPGLFFFPQDIAVRATGLFRLRLQIVGLQQLMEAQDKTMPSKVLAEAYTDVFETFSAKTFKNVMPVTQLTTHFTNQGVRLPGRAEKKDDGDD